jgi:hypothetical protein
MVLPGRIHRRAGRDTDRLLFLLQTFIDAYTKVSFAKLYYRKTPITAANLLNDRVRGAYGQAAARADLPWQPVLRQPIAQHKQVLARSSNQVAIESGLSCQRAKLMSSRRPALS